MTVKEFEVIADDICCNSICKECVLANACIYGELGNYDVWEQVYPHFLEDIPTRIAVREWIRENGYNRILK